MGGVILLDVFWRLLSLIALGVTASTLIGFLGRIWWVFDLFSHFRVQYLVSLGLCGLVFLAGGRIGWAILCAAFALPNLALILPIYRKPTPYIEAVTHRSDGNDPPGNPGMPQPRVYRVLLANVLQRNRQYERVADLIRSEIPDFIVLIEINDQWVARLAQVLSDYPHRMTPLRDDNYGLGLFSRIPFLSVQGIQFGEAGVPSVMANLDLSGQPLTVIGTHPPPPKSGLLHHQRNMQLLEIARFLANQPGPAVLLGDLNISSWSPFFQEMLRIGKLHDTRLGWGVQPSWPVDRAPLIVPIDHILVTDGITIQRRRRGPFTGSDHFPVLVEFTLCPSPSIK